jgi:hypothetical protein
MAAPSTSWSIVVEGRFEGAMDPHAVAGRLARVVRRDPRLAEPPAVEAIEESELPARREDFANRLYGGGTQLMRCAVVPGPPATILLAGHHGAVDGLGLLAALGVAADGPVSSSARGVGQATPRRSLTAWGAIRVARSLMHPPQRVARADHAGAERGDHLGLAIAQPLAGGTPRLTAATVRALASWNRSHGAALNRVEVAVGASVRSGDQITLEHQATWLRLNLRSGDDAEVAQAFAEAEPQPNAPPWQGPRVASLVAGWLARRVGFTVLVSNLGAVNGLHGLSSVAFWPAVHGRSGVAVGAASVGDRTTITVRAPRRGFQSVDTGRLADAVVRELSA